MLTIKFTFKDGRVFDLHLQTPDLVRQWLPRFSSPEYMESNGVASVSLSKNPPKAAKGAA